MDIPTTKDSPKHILNVLNNDCIAEIFRRIHHIEDFLNAAEVCQRFQESAKECFRTKFCDVTINYDTQDEWFNVKSNRANDFLEIFGSMIKRMHLSSTNDQKLDENLFKSVVKNCAKSLKELIINDQVVNFEHTQFEVLEYLHLGNSTPKNFGFGSPLKRFELRRFEPSEDGIWFMRKMPELEHLHFSSSKKLTDNMFSEFLSLNPNLKLITLSLCENLSALILKHIANFSPNVVELKTSQIFSYKFPDILNENIKYLCSLRNLRKITIEVNENVLIEKLINMFAENDIPIEELTIDLIPMRLEVIHRHKNLMTINTLKYFELNKTSGKNVAVKKILMNIVRAQTALETIILHYTGHLSIKDIKSFLKHGQNLSTLRCSFDKFSGDLNGFKRALFWAKHRVHVRLAVFPPKTHDIPENVLEENRDWININYATRSIYPNN